jgi:hypothetical protein
MACTTVLPTPNAPADVCKTAGVEFAGIQQPDAELDFDGLLLFNEPNGSTLAVALPTASVSAIRARLAEYQASNPAGEPFLEMLRRTRG